MLVKFGADEAFTPYRDVLEVDGAPVADRTTRLEQLFLQPGAEARTSAARISNESARYNLGRFKRNINVPTLALEYLKPANIVRCRFETPRAEQIGLRRRAEGGLQGDGWADRDQGLRQRRERAGQRNVLDPRLGRCGDSDGDSKSAGG